MSGDVQPRKRKDKKRKKEGASLGSGHEPVAFHKYRRSESDDLKSFDLPDQGEKIHVQNEHGVGGNICVKIIFFCLFGLLVGAVGLIYLKSQGSTDVDLPTIEESRFAEYFTGWLDDSTDDHEHEVHENEVDHGEHDDQEDHDDHDDEEDEDDDGHGHENAEEEEQSEEQDPIYKLFGLQDEGPEEVEESDLKATVVTESQSTINYDVDQDEEEDDDDDDEDDDEDKKGDSEEEEDEDTVDKQEEKEDTDEEDEEEFKNEMEDSEEEKKEHEADNTEEEMENDNDDDDDDDEEEQEEEEDKDKDEDEDEDEEVDEKTEKDGNDSGVDFKQNNYDDDDEEDEDLSQMDEDDEDKYVAFQKRTRKIPEESQEKDEDDNEDENRDDQSEDDEKADSAELEETDDEDQNDNEDVDHEEDSAEKKNLKFNAEDDLGFEEIDISEEDMEAGDEQKLKDQEKEREQSFAEKKKNLNFKQAEPEVEEEAEENNTGGVAVKLGVGIALIIVAHLVLVKKWKSMNNVPSDESASTTTIETSGKKEVENLGSSFEPVISRRQTLIPENVSLNDNIEEEYEEEEEEEDEEEEEEEVVDVEEEEDAEEVDIYPKECQEEEIKKTKNGTWETFGKPSWNVQKDENEEEDEGNVDIKELEEEEEEEEEDEEEEEEEEDEDEEEEEEEEEEGNEDEEEDAEEVEEDEEEEVDEVEEDNSIVKQKMLARVADMRQEEIKEAPTPPPRTRAGRGAQDVDQEFSDFAEFNRDEETNEDGPQAVDEINSDWEPEKQTTPEKKVGNEDEWAFRQELDFADEQLENNPKAAMEAFDKVISNKPTLIRALIGRAKALDRWAEKEKSNAYLKQAINAYRTVLFDHGHRLDDVTYVELAERCIERMRFAGNFVSAIDVHKALILKYPNTPKYRNTLAVTYLMLNKIPQARVLLNETLNLWPDNGVALVHYGFILKTSDNNMEEGAKKLMAGIQTREKGVIDGMFFFHLGDALNRLGREKEAMKWYEMGVKEGLFLSKYQRSLYNVNRLKGQPWWTKEETTYQDFFKKLEENWREIRREGLELLNSKGINLFKEEAENLKDTGDWKQLDLYFRGRKQSNCNKAPFTCSLVSSFKPASTCTRGQIKFSVMFPNTHVWPHCGPTNCRLRSHLGLVVPKKTFIRVAEETRSWEEGKFIIFDDSFEHEVWHNGTGLRLVLIVDVWHPELTNHERRQLSPI